MSAACLFNDHNQILLVRKRGTTLFMQPGGKLEPGESPQQAVIREVEEELGIRFLPSQLLPAGTWEGPAANEPGMGLLAHLFRGTLNARPLPRAELEELLWLDPREALLREDIAPLLREHVLPAAIQRLSPPD